VINRIGRTKGQLWKRTVMTDSEAMISNGGFGDLMRGIETPVKFGGREVEIPDEICSARRWKLCLLSINACLKN
jgi:hypothetical protein